MSEVITDQNQEIKERYYRMFHSHAASMNGSLSPHLQQLKKNALEELGQTPFPDRKNEDWKYTAVSPILRPEYNFAKKPSVLDLPKSIDNPIGLEDQIKLVYVNGHFVRDASNMGNSPEGVYFDTLEEAVGHAPYRSYIQESIESRVKNPQNAFELLNIAFSKNGLFIHVDRNVQVTRPIEIVYINSESDTPYFVHPQILIHVGQSSSLKIIERFESENSQNVYFTNASHIFDIENNARLDYVKIQRESKDAFHVHQIHTKQKGDSRYHAYVIDTGGKTIRNNHATYLQGENTETHLLGNYIATGNQSIDNQTFIDHALPNCYSNELYKGIAADRGKGVFNGKILVHQDAQKTNAFQQNASLVLSPYAVINAKPQLEIFADDVKCSHGATIGQLDEESVFYLRSRGLSDTAARRMLQKAFVDEVADHIEFKKVQQFAHTLIDEKLSTLSE